MGDKRGERITLSCVHTGLTMCGGGGQRKWFESARIFFRRFGWLTTSSSSHNDIKCEVFKGPGGSVPFKMQ